MLRRRDIALAALLVPFCTGAGGGVSPSVFGLVALALVAERGGEEE